MPTEQQDLFSDYPYIDPDKDYTEELVGEGKKYRDVPALSRKALYSDQHIARLETEQAALRKELDTRIKYEEFLDKINSSIPLDPNPNNQQGEPPLDVSAMKPQEIERLVDQRLDSKRQEEQVKQNLNSVIQELQKAYGPNYAQQLTRHTSELGMTQDQMHAIAASNPRVVFRLLGIAGESPQPKTNLFEAPPRTQMSTLPQTKGKGYSYYEEIRKKDPREYFSPKIQNEMFNRLRDVGEEAFYNN